MWRSVNANCPAIVDRNEEKECRVICNKLLRMSHDKSCLQRVSRDSETADFYKNLNESVAFCMEIQKNRHDHEECRLISFTYRCLSVYVTESYRRHGTSCRLCWGIFQGWWENMCHLILEINPVKILMHLTDAENDKHFISHNSTIQSLFVALIHSRYICGHLHTLWKELIP